MSKKRRGSIKHGLIRQLTKEANESLKMVRHHKNAALKYALICGAALNKIRYETRKRNWKKTGWQEWLKQNFNGCYETANDYCKIARVWNTPKLVETRKKKGLESIRAVLNVIRPIKKREEKPETPTKLTEAMQMSFIRQELREKFAAALKDLVIEELEVFEEGFDTYWEKLYKQIYHGACCALEVLEGDLNELLYLMGKLDSAEPNTKNLKSRRNIIREAERQAKEDVKVVNKQKRLEAFRKYEKDRKRGEEVMQRIQKKMNKRWKRLSSIKK